MHFDPDAAASEVVRARPVIATLARNTLVLGDRLYSTAAFFDLLRAHRCWGVVRRQPQLSLHRLQRLRRRRFRGGDLEDWLVRAGTGATAPVQTLRYIGWRRASTRFEVLTNVVSATQLPAEEALTLYPFRWSIERMFFELKEVLNLNRLYAANPNAVAMQVYAAAIVYNAMRVAQSEAAVQLDEPPEDLSPAKLFPKIAVASFLYANGQQLERQWQRRHRHAHPHVVVRWRAHRWARTAATTTRVEPRSEVRRRRRFCVARRHWKSPRLVRGGRRYLAKLS